MSAATLSQSAGQRFRAAMLEQMRFELRPLIGNVAQSARLWARRGTDREWCRCYGPWFVTGLRLKHILDAKAEFPLIRLLTAAGMYGQGKPGWDEKLKAEANAFAGRAS